MSAVLLQRVSPVTGQVVWLHPVKDAATLAVWDRWGSEIANARCAAAAGERKAVNDRRKSRWAR